MCHEKERQCAYNGIRSRCHFSDVDMLQNKDSNSRRAISLSYLLTPLSNLRVVTFYEIINIRLMRLQKNVANAVVSATILMNLGFTKDNIETNHPDLCSDSSDAPKVYNELFTINEVRTGEYVQALVV